MPVYKALRSSRSGVHVFSGGTSGLAVDRCRQTISKVLLCVACSWFARMIEPAKPLSLSNFPLLSGRRQENHCPVLRIIVFSGKVKNGHTKWHKAQLHCKLHWWSIIPWVWSSLAHTQRKHLNSMTSCRFILFTRHACVWLPKVLETEIFFRCEHACFPVSWTSKSRFKVLWRVADVHDARSFLSDRLSTFRVRHAEPDERQGERINKQISIKCLFWLCVQDIQNIEESLDYPRDTFAKTHFQDVSCSAQTHSRWVNVCCTPVGMGWHRVQNLRTLGSLSISSPCHSWGQQHQTEPSFVKLPLSCMHPDVSASEPTFVSLHQSKLFLRYILRSELVFFIFNSKRYTLKMCVCPWRVAPAQSWSG